MVTFTIRHEGYMPLRRTMKGLAKAWRRVRQGGSVQDTWTARVTGSVRAFEVTHSRRNGWHPHVHVLLRTSEWSDDERADLLVRWRAAVEREIGAECVPSFERAVAWSEPIDLCRGDALGETEHRRTRYLFKLGLEVAGSGKRGRRGSRTPWQIAEDATRGDSESVDLWREYASATRGHRMISLDARAQRFAKTPMAAVLDVNIAQPWEDEHESERVTIAVDELELQAFRHYERTTDPAILAVVLADIASAERPETTARAWIDIVCRKLSYSLRHGRSPPPLDSS